MRTLGADVLRLWVAATDYANEMSVLGRDPEAHVATPTAACATRCASCSATCTASIRRADAVARRGAGRARPLGDRARAATLQGEVATAYRNYEFHTIYQKVHNFCVRRAGRLLPGHHQGPPVHDAARTAHRAARRRPRCITSPRRWCAGSRRFSRSRPRRSGATCPGPRRPRVGVADDLARVPAPCRAVHVDWEALHRAAHRRWRASSSGCAIAGAIGAPLDAEVDVYCAAAACTRAMRRWATSCASC